MAKRSLKISDWRPAELIKWRQDNGLSQLEAALILGVSLRAVENWEQGVRRPAYPASVRKLMKAGKPRRRSA